MTRVPPHRLSVLAAFALPLVAGLYLFDQGISLMDDGLWLFGTQVLADGGVLYKDVMVIYGPARFVLLLPFFAIFGQSASALVVLKACTLSAAAGAGFLLARRHGWRLAAWGVPLLLIGLAYPKPKYVVAGLLALLVAEALSRSWARRGWLALGAAWGVLAWFGLDAFFYGAVILGGTLLVPFNRAKLRCLLWTVPGLAAGLLVPLVWALVTGSLGEAWWDTVIYPLTRFRPAMGVSPLETFRSPFVLGQTFVHNLTGEPLGEKWPGHAAMLVLGYRLLYLGLVAVPVLSLVQVWRGRGGPHLAAVTWFAVAGWSTAAGLSDQSHVAAAWLAVVWLLPLLLGTVTRGRVLWRSAAGLFLLAAFAPLLMEAGWLLANGRRDTLVRWERPTAGIRLAAYRIEGLEYLFKHLPEDPSVPVGFWPNKPGLNFLLGYPTVSRQVTLLGGEVRDPAAVIAELETLDDHRFFFSPQNRQDQRQSKDVIPEIWQYLRANYVRAGDITNFVDEFSVMRPVPEGRSLSEVALWNRVYEVKQSAALQVGPAMVPGVTVGQTLDLNGVPLRGLALRFQVQGRLSRLPLRVQVHPLRAGRPAAALFRKDFRVDLDGANALAYLDLGEVPIPAGTQFLFTVELLEDPGRSVKIWLSPDNPPQGYPDRYPDGQAWLQGRPAPADLYFVVF